MLYVERDPKKTYKSLKLFHNYAYLKELLKKKLIWTLKYPPNKQWVYMDKFKDLTNKNINNTKVYKNKSVYDKLLNKIICIEMYTMSKYLKI